MAMPPGEDFAVEMTGGDNKRSISIANVISIALRYDVMELGRQSGNLDKKL